MANKRNAIDWGLFSVLSILWGLAYPLNRLAVNMGDTDAGFPPQLVMSGRVTIGAVILLCVAFATRQTFPRWDDYRRWGAIAGLGLIGTAFPFLMISTAQKDIASSLAALYVAAAPLFVAALAHFFFTDERMTAMKALGLLVGFSGVALLFGPDAISSFGSAGVLAQGLCLAATLCYSVATIIARGAPSMPPFVLSAGFVSVAAVFSYTLLPTVDFEAVRPSASAWMGLIGLGILPTAAASLFYMVLVSRTSATFLSLTGYTIPIFSAVIGFVAFGEVQSWLSVLAFVLILAGVWISQHTGQEPKSPPAPEDA